jgi:PPOX class probable F420-dependent enzyme
MERSATDRTLDSRWVMMATWLWRLVVLTMQEFDEFRRQRNVLLTTRKRDGTAVSTPVHIALGPDGRAYFRTWSTAGKAKRMRNFPQVWIAPCTVRGKATGRQQQATAVLLTGPEAVAAAQALGAKYPVLQGVLVPYVHRLTNKTTVHYELLPPEAA